MWVFTAVFGGASPTLANLAGYLTTGYGDPAMPGFGYWVGISIYALLGAVVAYVFSDKSHIDAFKVGVIAPALIFSFTNAQLPTDARSALLPGVVSVATAQNVDIPELIGNESFKMTTKKLFLKVDDRTNAQMSQQLRLEYIDPNDPAKTVVSTVSNGAVEIPASVNKLHVGFGNEYISVGVPDRDATLNVNVQPNTSFANQLIWALTGRQNMYPPDIKASILAAE